jgi:hypothetical protein
LSVLLLTIELSILLLWTIELSILLLFHMRHAFLLYDTKFPDIFSE